MLGLRNTFKIGGIGFLCLFFILLSFDRPIPNDFKERVKVSLREVGNQLLLQNEDSTSLVLPITAVKSNVYQLQFENKLSIDPDYLVSLIEDTFKTSDLPKNYIVEVLNCSDREVHYSYEQKKTAYNSIIPCSGRLLPKHCYAIDLKFTDASTSFVSNSFKYLSVGGAVLLLFLGFRETKDKESHTLNDNFSVIGQFRFYPYEHKIVKATSEIPLSKKECELLEILMEHLNSIVKREELEKRVWEDQGVFVGRSLDTYISKLRKKFKEDPSIKITNIHGVGYKLEVNQS